MRTISAEIIAELEKGTIAPVLIADLDTSPDPVRVWNGIGTLMFQSSSFIVVGTLGGLSSIKETAGEVKANEVIFRLTGIPSDLITVALTTGYQGRSAKLWLGLLDSAGALIDTILLFSGRMDVMDIDEGPETSTIDVTAESRLADLNRPRTRRYTDQDQRELYPGDLGLEYVASIQVKEFPWSA